MSVVKKVDALVIGSGPGGYVCAIRLAQLGKRTAIIERESVGGVCLNVGCIPSKALIYAASRYWNIQNEVSEIGIHVSSLKVNLKEMQVWKNSVVKKLTAGVSSLLKANGVEVIKGTASFKSPTSVEIKGSNGVEVVEAPQVVVATGSRTVEIPNLPFNGKNIISSTEALELEELPKKMIVVGGGFIGLEIGMVYAKLGSQVTIVEALDQLLPNTDRELIQVVEKRMKKLGMAVHVNAKASGLQEKDSRQAKFLHLNIEAMGKPIETLEADVILVSVGRKPNSEGIGLDIAGVKCDPKGNILINGQGMTNVAGIFAIGDVTGAPQLAHRASMDGILVAEAICGERTFRDYRTVPWAVFSDPEIACCGLSEKEAQEKGIRVRVGRFPFAASGRALSTNESDGFVKVLVNDSDHSLVGVQIVGPEASNLIAEATLAIEMGASAEDIFRTIHTHPTLPEAFPEAVEAAFSRAIHIYKPGGGAQGRREKG